ncbi:MAG: ATPase domain-containing protein [Candidatus Pacearchaeota archaeon]
MKKKSKKGKEKMVRKKSEKKEKSKKEKSRKKAEIKIEKTKQDKVLTGISVFDKITEGGFNKESVNLIVGGAGAGKTIFAMQFLMHGLKRGETCLYITFEEKKDELYRNMLKLGWDLAAYEKKGKFIFVEYTPEKVKKMLEEGGGALESLMYKKNIARLVIDSITSFTLLFESEIAKREAALALFDMTRRWKTTVLLTLEKELTLQDLISGSASAIEFEADSVILLYFLRQNGMRNRILEVLKMRGTKHSRNLYPFEITSRGIELSEKPIEKISKQKLF